MAITNYTELKAAVADYMARTDITGNVADFIALGEARLNRTIGPVTRDAIVSGTQGSRTIDISSLSLVQPIALNLQDAGDEAWISIRPDGSFFYTDVQAKPSYAAIESGHIDFNCLLSQPWTFRLTYQTKLALSTTSPTNWMLTDNPDVYLAAAMVWGGIYTQNDSRYGQWKSILDEFTAEAARMKMLERGNMMTVDAALTGRRRYNSATDTII